MACLANAIGNKSLCNSNYEAFFAVRKKEMNVMADILASLAVAGRNIDKKQHALKIASSQANSLKQYLHLKLTLNSWKR
jgi:hypothetical protein